MSTKDPFNAQTLAIGPSSSAQITDLPRSFASGRYLIQRPLGEGGQKQVYLARDTRLDRDVVIALLKTDQLEADSVPRLIREAQAMARLGNHPNIVTVYDIGDESGRPFIVSQYIEAGSVSDLLNNADKRRLPVDQVIRIASQVCQALVHCHSQGIIHRDLKPGNVWLTQDGTAKLGDFGLAVSADFSRITMEGTLVGTAVYLPPECLLGRQAEPRSDLYSLGVMLYEIVTGRPPFLGDQLIGIISQHINSPPVAPSWHNPEIPQSLETLILRLLAKTPEERPESAADVASVLMNIAASSSTSLLPADHQDAKSLARLAGGVFVGREQETRELRAALEDALAGQGRLVMLVGEPGGGKTRMTEQLAMYGRLCNAQVLTGSCYEGEGAPAFWPWMQIIRSYVHERESEAIFSIMGPGAADIAQVVSVIRERLPYLPSPPALEPEQARFRLFDSVTTFLKSASKVQPLIVILDDLHWADKPSLLLLQFVARELKGSRLLVIGTYRDMELGRQHPLSRTLGELSRQGLSARITLRGLTERDVERFIEMTTGIKTAESLVTTVYKQTEGNPFFLNEIVRLLVVEGQLERPELRTASSIRIPEGVREVIGRRLDRLSEECNRVLTIASVIGREFSLDALEPLSDIADDRLLEILDEAVAARVINEAAQLGNYSFAHALIRETLYDETSIARRVRLHRRIGEVLEKLHSKSLESHLTELAYHFFQASAAGNSDKAIDYAVRAAKRATSLLAYEEAAGHYEHALAVVELQDEVDEKQRLEMFLALGDSQKKAGNTAKARDSFLQAADLSRKSQAPEQLARAALGIAASLSAAIGKVDEVQVRLLNEALNALGEEDSSLRATVLAHLSAASYYSPELREPLSRQAVEMARRLSDPTAKMAALYSRHIALAASADVEEKLAIATEILELAEQADDKERMLRAHYLCILDLLELGDVAAADEEIEAYANLATELRQPIYLWHTPYFRASRALLEGRFQECERLAREALALGQRAQDVTAPIFFEVQMTVLRMAQGQVEDREDAIKRFIEKYSKIVGEQATLANLYCRLDRREDAQRVFEQVAADDFASLPRDGSWIVTMANLSHVCAYLGDARRAATLYELLLPYARRQLVIGSTAVAAGSVSRYLGVTAATMCNWEEAASHFDDALEMSARMRARPFVAFAQKEYGAMLLTRNSAGDREKALELLDEALATANELGMHSLISDVLDLKSNLSA